MILPACFCPQSPFQYDSLSCWSIGKKDIVICSPSSCLLENMKEAATGGWDGWGCYAEKGLL